MKNQCVPKVLVQGPEGLTTQTTHANIEQMQPSRKQSRPPKRPLENIQGSEERMYTHIAVLNSKKFHYGMHD